MQYLHYASTRSPSKDRRVMRDHLKEYSRCARCAGQLQPNHHSPVSLG